MNRHCPINFDHSRHIKKSSEISLDFSSKYHQIYETKSDNNLSKLNNITKN